MNGGGLNICLVIEPSGGGSGRHVLDLAKGLAELDHEVTVIWSPVRAETQWSQQLFDLHDVHNIPSDMHRSVAIHDIRSLSDLKARIRENGPYDIIHAHSSKAGALVRALPKSISGKRIYTPHAFVTMDPELNPIKRSFFARIERGLSNRGEVTIAVSEAERLHAQQIGIHGNVVKVVNGTNKLETNDRVNARQQMGIDDDAFLIGFVGRLSYQKNPQRFVRILNNANLKNEHILGVVIGDGEMRRALETANKSNITSVKFLGWQDAPRLMVGLDVFFMSSRYEAMPYTLLEALTFGLPIVSTHVGGTDETIVEDQNGKVFPQDANDIDIADFLVKLAGNKKMHAEYRKKSLSLAENVTMQKMVQQTLDVYRQAIASQ